MKQALIYRILIILISCNYIYEIFSTPISSPNWEELKSTDGIKFSGRNAHASCVFKGKIWVIGGRTDRYVQYNLLDAYSVADVWHSEDGAIWAYEKLLTGDYFAQNTDVVQPGEIAPFYARYGHSLNALDITGDSIPDIMILIGGYSPSPSNDVWITTDGTHWIFVDDESPWSPRAWHSTVIFKGKLYMLGGTPLNIGNEVWYLDTVNIKPRIAPLTRSIYSNYTYELAWVQLPDAPWSPRVGAGVVSHWYFNTSLGETMTVNSRERILLVGGYGGWLQHGNESSRYDGFISRADTWHTYDGIHWVLLNSYNTFEERGWVSLIVMHAIDPRYMYPSQNQISPPKVYLFGGGYIGFYSNSKKRVNAMVGRADAWYSTDGIQWVKVNYEEGGGKTGVAFFSSQEWASTIVDTKQKYIGKWGHTAVSFNEQYKNESNGHLYLIGGSFTDGGDYTPSVYRNLPGIFCDVKGVICNNAGTCGDEGCICIKDVYGIYCTEGNVPIITTNTGAFSIASTSKHQLLQSTIMLSFISIIITINII